VAKPELGTKRTCPECTAKFYDLGKEPCVCPKCEHTFEPEILLKSKRRPDEVVQPKEAPKKKEATEEEEEADEAEAVEVVDLVAGTDGDDDGDEEEAVADGIEVIEIDDEDDESDDTLINMDDEEDSVAGIIDVDIAKPES
jgi:uncharacterized protein (TIGR02300 family)